MATHPFLDTAGPVAIAHRGGAGPWPENTMPAFENAARLGYGYIETDVHATLDGVLVAFHDQHLDRVTDTTGAIAEHRWSDLRAVRVGGSEAIVRFDELLQSFPEVRVNIDPKSDTAVEPLITLLRQHSALDRVCVGSFSDARLGRVHDAFGRSVCLSAGTREALRMRAVSLGWPWRRFRARCAQVPIHQGRVRIVDRRFVDRMHSLGIDVHVWTIDDPRDMRELLDLGVDGIMTDQPEVLAEVFAERDLPLH